MAAQVFKDPYLFDFLGTADPRRELEGPGRYGPIVESSRARKANSATTGLPQAFRKRGTGWCGHDTAYPDGNRDKVSGYGPAASRWRRIPSSIPPK